MRPGNINMYTVRIGLASAMVLSLASAALSYQSGGGGMAGGGGGQGGDGSGNERATITGYLPPKDGDTDSGGVIRIKTETGKTVAISISTKENLSINIGSHAVTAEEYSKVFLPGLGVSAGWRATKGAGRSNVLTSLTFETLTITGKLVSVSDEPEAIIRVFGRPSSDKDWPTFKKAPPPPKPKEKKSGRTERPGKSKPPKPPPPPREKTVRNKQLQIAFLEGVLTITDNSNASLTPADLKEFKDTQITGDVVYGPRTCLVVSLKLEGERETAEDDAGGAGKGR